MLGGLARPTIYIAGPMTGYADFNFPLFDKTADEWDGRGYAVLNPADAYRKRQDLSYQQYMKSALYLLMQAGAIALLPGWQDSQGACMEALVAKRLGLFFYDALTGDPLNVPELEVGLTGPSKLPASLSDVHLAILNHIAERTLSCGNKEPCEFCGDTCDRTEEVLRLSHSTCSFRMWELQKLGLIEKGPFMSDTRSGRPAVRYLATPAGKERLNA